MEREREKKSNFIVQKPDKYYFSQAVKFDILNSNHEKNPNWGTIYKMAWSILLKIIKVIKQVKSEKLS